MVHTQESFVGLSCCIQTIGGGHLHMTNLQTWDNIPNCIRHWCPHHEVVPGWMGKKIRMNSPLVLAFSWTLNEPMAKLMSHCKCCSESIVPDNNTAFWLFFTDAAQVSRSCTIFMKTCVCQIKLVETYYSTHWLYTQPAGAQLNTQDKTYMNYFIKHKVDTGFSPQKECYSCLLYLPQM